MTQSQLFTVLRVKRKVHDEPIDTFIVDTSKKRKSVEENDEYGTTKNKVFKRVDTIDMNDDVDEQFIFENLLEKSKVKKDSDIEAPNKTEKRKNPAENSNGSQKEEANKFKYSVTMKNKRLKIDFTSYQVIDISKEDPEESEIRQLEEDSVKTDPIMCNLIPMVREYLNVSENRSRETPIHVPKEEDYVFDLFVEHHQPIFYVDALKIERVEISEDEFDYDTDSDEDEYLDEDDDSNAEDNWRNDYPDEEEYLSEEPEFSGDENDYEFY